jgi:hypothetical protein
LAAPLAPEQPKRGQRGRHHQAPKTTGREPPAKQVEDHRCYHAHAQHPERSQAGLKVAAYKEKDFDRLMNDAGIIRNRLKINAAIENAKTILGLQKEFGSFKNWLAHHHPKTREEWTKLFKKAFKFTGGEIVNEFIMSAGYIPGAHDKDCPVYKKVIKAKPRWNEK